MQDCVLSFSFVFLHNLYYNSFEVCKKGLETDTLRKQIYTLLIQQIYVADATYKYSMNEIFEACLSWKIAKQYGYKKDDFGFNKMCE